MLKIITGNILSADEQYIAHQCNCVTTSAAGLADVIFKKWSYADCYSIRWEKDKPGTIDVRGNGYQNRYVVNMFAQVYPGKPKDAEDPYDGFQARKKYFIECMTRIDELKPKSVAVPWLIGSGMACGDFSFYKKVVEKFSERFNITFYKLPGTP